MSKERCPCKYCEDLSVVCHNGTPATLDWEKSNINTEYGKGYFDGFDVAQEYTVNDIVEMLERMSQEYAIMRSLGATQAADALLKAAQAVRNGDYNK